MCNSVVQFFPFPEIGNSRKLHVAGLIASCIMHNQYLSILKQVIECPTSCFFFKTELFWIEIAKKYVLVQLVLLFKRYSLQNNHLSF